MSSAVSSSDLDGGIVQLRLLCPFILVLVVLSLALSLQAFLLQLRLTLQLIQESLRLRTVVRFFLRSTIDSSGLLMLGTGSGLGSRSLVHLACLPYGLPIPTEGLAVAGFLPHLAISIVFR